MQYASLKKQDIVFMKLEEKVKKVIKTPKEWKEFKRFCDFYYNNAAKSIKLSHKNTRQKTKICY